MTRRPAPLLLLLVCLFGSTLQGFIGQTHLHPVRGLSPAAASQQLAPALPPEPACLLCEIAGHSPGFAPAPVAFLPMPMVAVRVATQPVLRPVSSRASHHWHGRGPPLA